jgi:prepilin-type N-terminal cleavage/methylation domain-containing protein/prepilin-type processing-associated H-X9-DG protein
LVISLQPPRRALGRQTLGFSLVELMCVVAILAILTILSISSAPARRQKGQMTACQNNLMFIHQALGTYATDHDGKFPANSAAVSSDLPLSLLVPAHTVRTESFICPGSDHRKLPAAKPFTGRRISYSYAMGLTHEPAPGQWLVADAQLNARAKAVGELIFSPDGKGPGNNHGGFGGNVLFADGHAEFSPTNSAFEIHLPVGVKLLNPKP